MGPAAGTPRAQTVQLIETEQPRVGFRRPLEDGRAPPPFGPGRVSHALGIS
jgi:hypothetical protein